MKIYCNDSFTGITGSVKVQLFDEHGTLVQSREEHNLVVTVGKTALATWLTGAQASGFMQWIAVGFGTTSPLSGDTAMQSETGTRVSGTLTSASNTLTNTATFLPGNGTGAITEFGLFSASSSGTMFSHQVQAAYNKRAVDTLVVTWSISFN